MEGKNANCFRFACFKVNKSTKSKISSRYYMQYIRTYMPHTKYLGIRKEVSAVIIANRSKEDVWDDIKTVENLTSD